MSNNRTIVIKLTGDSSQLQKVFKAADADAGTFESRMKARGDKLVNAGKNMSIGLTAPLVLFGKSSVDVASNADEALSKVGKVFRENADDIEQWAQGAAENIGVSRREALEAAGTLGNLFSAMKVGLPAATDMSKGLVQLAGDLASFNDANPTEVLEALRSGLVGEAEPLRKFGVSLSAARIEQEALNMGLGNAKGELDAAAKAQAAYKIIMDDTALAQGDFVDTADGLANSTRTAAAELDDMKVELGEELVPLTKQAVGVGRDLVGVFADMSPAAQKLTVQLAGAAAVAGPLTTAVGGIMKISGGTVGAYQKISEWVGNARLQMALGRNQGMSYGQMLTGFLNPAMLAGGVAVGLLSAQLLVNAQRKQEVLGLTEKLRAAQELENSGTADATREYANQELARRGLIDSAIEMGVNLDDLRKAWLGDEKALVRVKESTDLYVDSNRRLGVVTLGVAGRVESFRDQLGQAGDAAAALKGEKRQLTEVTEELGDKTGKSAAAQEEHTDAQRDGEMSAKDLADAMKLLDEKTSDYIDRLFGATDAQVEWREQIDELSDSVKENGTTLDTHTEKGRANYSQLKSLVTAGLAHRDAVLEQTKSVDKADNVAERYRKRLYEKMRQLGFSKKAAEDYSGAIKDVPDKVATKFDTPGMDKAQRDVKTLKDAMSGFGRTVGEIGGDIRVNVSGGWSKGIANANGNVLEYYANGGTRENHVAQIAPAGAWRVWAEPETGGEAYIPLAASKRGRSERILAEVAERFGMTVEKYANGGINTWLQMAAESSVSSKGMPTATLVGIGNFLESVGFRVGEHPAFGGVNGVHSEGSRHYVGQAFDANYGPGGASAIERAAIKKYLPAVVAMAGGRLRENLHPFNDPAHADHWHVAFENGGILEMANGGVFSGTPGLNRKIRNVQELIDELLGTIGKKGPTDRQSNQLDALRERRENLGDYRYQQLGRRAKIRVARRALRNAKPGTSQWMEWRQELDNLEQERTDVRTARAERQDDREDARDERRAERATRRKDARAERKQTVEDYQFDRWWASASLDAKISYAQKRLDRVKHKGSERWLHWRTTLDDLLEEKASGNSGGGITPATPPVGATTPDLWGSRQVLAQTGVGGVKVNTTPMQPVQLVINDKVIAQVLIPAMTEAMRLDTVANS